MCERLSELRRALGCYAQAFDASVLSGTGAGEVVEAASAIENVAATIKAVAAARVAETGDWRRAGERSAAHHLARTTGSTVGLAADALETARRLERLPDVAAAARRGALSAAQVSAIADAATAEPGAADRLLAKATVSSLAELREECGRTKAAACPDPEARRRAVHARRFLRSYCDAEGAWVLHMRDNPEVGAEVMGALEPIRDRLFRAARAEGRREAPEAYAADALVELARGGGEGARPARARPKVIARVDLAALLRGYPTEGEVCELAGYGPVAVSALRDLLDTADPFLAAVVTRGEAVVGVAHLGRRPTARQQTALEWLYPTCGAEGCTTIARLENDHRVDWSRSHVTVFDLLDRVCEHHHDLKTREAWAFVPGRGKRAFVPPDDPRHPRHAGHGHCRPPPVGDRAAALRGHEP